jgi:hypothetical protein
MRKLLETAECADAANNSCADIVLDSDCESLSDEEELPILKEVTRDKIKKI